MANLPWLDDVLGRLEKRGLPPSYVRRLADELSDHLEDLQEQNMGKEADVSLQLGKPEQVAAAAVAAYRRRSFSGRHPVAAFFFFAITPVLPLFLLAVVAEAAFSIVVNNLLGLRKEHFGPACRTSTT